MFKNLVWCIDAHFTGLWVYGCVKTWLGLIWTILVCWFQWARSFWAKNKKGCILAFFPKYIRPHSSNHHIRELISPHNGAHITTSGMAWRGDMSSLIWWFELWGALFFGGEKGQNTKKNLTKWGYSQTFLYYLKNINNLS